MNYYNDNDPYCCEWLENLIKSGNIPCGVVDSRDIRDVRSHELTQYTQCHFFCGIAGWPLALQLAGWPADAPVWTGSCPCQPYSTAGKGLGDADPRNLWPAFFRLIRECRPPVVFGEQVASAIRHGWLDGICRDLETQGYACGAAVLGAHSVGAPHIRQRLFWVADATSARRETPVRRNWINERDKSLSGCRQLVDRLGDSISPRLEGRPSQPGDYEPQQSAVERAGDDADRLADAADSRCKGAEDRRASRKNATGGTRCSESERDSDVDRLGNTSALRRQGRDWTSQQEQGTWSRCALVLCRDGKTRRISAQPGDEPLAHGIPSRTSDPRMGHLLARLAELGHDTKAARRILKEARRNRVGRLRGYGNAIVPQVAAAFIRSYLDFINDIHI